MSVEGVGTSYVDPVRLRKQPLCIEIGANRGRFAVAFLERFGGRMIAYEPGRIADEIPETPGLEIRREAVWKNCEPISFCECPEQPQSSSIFTRTPRRGVAEMVNVTTVSLAIALRRFPWVDFVNMDVEGAEWDILASGSIRHLRRVGQICIEFHTEFAGQRKLQDMIDRLEREAFFKVRVINNEHDTRPIIYGYKPEMSPRKPSNAWLRKLLAGRKFGRVLNLGCGSDSDFEGGTYSAYIDADEIVNVDATPGPAVNVVAPAEDLPFDDDNFDFVFANWLIYKTDLPRSLKEIARVLKPGGQVMLSYGHPDANFVTAIRATLRSMFKISESFAMDYVAKRSTRRAEAVFGTLRPDVNQCLYLSITSPVLVIVAHWDDEVLSLCGSLSRYGKGWTVVSATHRDQQPAYEDIFKGICGGLGVNGITLDIRQRERPLDVKNDEDRHHYTRNVKRVPLDRATVEPALIKALGNLSRFKTVITHSENGDYGSHPSHKELAASVQQIFGETADVWSFNAKAGTVAIPLSPTEVEKKWRLIKCYKPSHKLEDVFASEFFIRLRGAD